MARCRTEARYIWALFLVIAVGLSFVTFVARADAVFTFTPVLTIDALNDVRGGVRAGARTMYNLDLMADWKGDHGWEAWGYVLVDGNGGFSSRYSGDLQTVSNIDALPAARLFEAWGRYTSLDGRWKTTLGLINLNGIFDLQPVGSVFLNSSAGIGPDFSQAAPPIFPVTGLGAVAEWRMTPYRDVRVGLFDGTPGDPNHPEAFVAVHFGKAGGLLHVVEVEQRFDTGLIKFGHWGYTFDGVRWNSAGNASRQGIYGQLVWRLVDEVSDASQGLQSWVRVGVANDETFRIDRYVGAGLNYTGLFEGHDSDQFGIAVMQAHLGRPYRLMMVATSAAETTTELTYKSVVNGHAIVQPDLQFIHHPAGDSRLKNAIVMGVRLKLQ